MTAMTLIIGRRGVLFGLTKATRAIWRCRGDGRPDDASPGRL